MSPDPRAETIALIDPLIDQLLGNRWRIKSKMAEGAMGVVYLAHDEQLDMLPVAVKVLKPSALTSLGMASRFAAEARGAARIGNHHIITVHGHGMHAGVPYIAMELVEGTDLGKIIDTSGGPIGVRRALNIAIQLCSALEAAHNKGIVHRDLKPPNIMVADRPGEKDFVKVLDFGIAQHDASDIKLTQTGELMGTPHYMSPEQSWATRDVDHRTDIYALGCILFEMLTNRFPYPGETFVQVTERHRHDPIPVPSQFAGDQGIPPDLDSIVVMALAKKPEDRIQSMGELRGLLEGVRTLMDLTAPAPTPTEDSARPQGEPRPTSGRSTRHTTVSRRTSSQRRRTSSGGPPRIIIERASRIPLIIFLLLLIGGGAAAYWKQNEILQWLPSLLKFLHLNG